MLGNETTLTFKYKGHDVELVACWDSETPEGEVDFYDLYVDGQCYTLGDPFYEKPSVADVEAAIEGYWELYPLVR